MPAVWYLIQKSRGRRFIKFRDRGSDGDVNTNMAQGQMQLAMKETVVRKRRYVRAIRWLIDNLTEDAEIEKFLSAKPGSFNTGWGMEVWKRMGKYHESEGKRQGEPVATRRPHRDIYKSSPNFHILGAYAASSVSRPLDCDTRPDAGLSGGRYKVSMVIVHSDVCQ